MEKAKSSSQRRTNTPLIIRDEEEVDVEEENESDYKKFHEENIDEDDLWSLMMMSNCLVDLRIYRYLVVALDLWF